MDLFFVININKRNIFTDKRNTHTCAFLYSSIKQPKPRHIHMYIYISSYKRMINKLLYLQYKKKQKQINYIYIT